MSLLVEKIKKQRTKRVIRKNALLDEELIEIALSYIKEEIKIIQINKEITNTVNSSAAYVIICRGIKKAFKKGILKIV